MLCNLKRLRLQNRVTQLQLANAVGVSQQSINKYENHNIEPDIDTLIAIADYFHTSVDDLVGHAWIPVGSTESILLTQDELDVICKYRMLSAEEKESIHLILKNYNNR